MTIWTDHEYFNWAVSGRASKADKSHQSQRWYDLSVPCVEISINIQRCFTMIGRFEKCHIIDKTFCINQLNGHTLSVSGYLNTNVLVTKISSKAVSIDHLTEGCKKCVNMGVVAVARNMFYQNLLSLWHSGRHRTLVPNKQYILSCSSFLCWREEQARKTHGNIILIPSVKHWIWAAKYALKLWVCLVSLRNFTRSEGVLLHDSWMHFWWSLWDTPLDHIQLDKN